ncbi:unnamed protein product, partial [Scytosiphon promiscuus]
NKKLPKAKDYGAVDEEAQVAEMFVENVKRIVPSDKWTPQLRREVDTVSFERVNVLDIYLKPHDRETKDEVAQLLEQVSTGDQNSSRAVQLRDLISTVVTCKPLGRIRAILSKDATLRPHLMSWDAKYQDVIKQVNLHEARCGARE